MKELIAKIRIHKDFRRIFNDKYRKLFGAKAACNVNPVFNIRKEQVTQVRTIIYIMTLMIHSSY